MYLRLTYNVAGNPMAAPVNIYYIYICIIYSLIYSITNTLKHSYIQNIYYLHVVYYIFINYILTIFCRLFLFCQLEFDRNKLCLWVTLLLYMINMFCNITNKCSVYNLYDTNYIFSNTHIPHYKDALFNCQ